MLGIRIEATVLLLPCAEGENVMCKECRELQEEQVASFFQAYFGPIGQLEISPEIVVIRVKSQSLFMALGQISDKPFNKYQN